MHRGKKRGSREVLTALEIDSSGLTCRRGGPVAGVVHPEVHNRLTDELEAGHGVCEIERGGEERRGSDGDDIQMCTGTAKRKGIDETNAMVCSPSAKDK
jgi:hypothetical protein